MWLNATEGMIIYFEGIRMLKKAKDLLQLGKILLWIKYNLENNSLLKFFGDIRTYIYQSITL